MKEPRFGGFAVREGDWKVAPIPEDLQDRRVEITGPPESLEGIREALAAAEIEPESAAVTNLASTAVELEPDVGRKALELLQALAVDQGRAGSVLRTFDLDPKALQRALDSLQTASGDPDADPPTSFGARRPTIQLLVPNAWWTLIRNDGGRYPWYIDVIVAWITSAPRTLPSNEKRPPAPSSVPPMTTAAPITAKRMRPPRRRLR